MGLELSSPLGSFQLKRLPFRKNELLRAWDAADEYLLNHLAAAGIAAHANIVILNDSFGALAVVLSAYRPTAISDSWLSQQATRNNLALNGIADEQVRLLDSLSLPETGIDYLLIKIPKTLALLEYQLHRLRPLLKADCLVIATGMVKTLPPSAWKLLERLIGPTQPSLAVKKARLIFASVDQNLQLPENPYPTRYQLENSDLSICNHANVFSRDSLDIGTRFLLEHLPQNPEYRNFIDLGCGNGIVGVMLAKQNPKAQIGFIDESFMAIASARENFSAAFSDTRQADFLVADCLSDYPEKSADCIVCNPPFHQQHTIGDHIAWQMFQQAHKVLRKGGELRVIGNRHLNYHLALKKLFGNCRQVAANAKFVIFSCVKS
ncbi:MULTISPECIES: methyltransferase [Methylomonas]|uniref:Ribosomal RNA large subunit methyltransferase G n=2 Tax=Methylomonas TaxID=416 RepID=A0A126T6Y7_9GAMM|nr:MULTISPECIES: methyltransferase [Methylomonas]AMK77849.1 50S rRNA methyltransferase [Methylomonas denitrificans]OAI00928.1 50S rRNA methyltransferase [Methylomonas methanica]TCV87020.1 16S rRNA (guanine1207-N2)-methyltransferase [Methylomonas methanica]